MAYETSQSEPTSVELLLDSERFLWLVAVVFFGIGDLVTTAIGLQLQYVVEAGPVVGDVIRAYGTTSMIWLKMLVFVLCYGLWRVVPAPHRVGVPLGLAVLGVLVTLWNVFVMGIAVL
ncbi:hypothetical protein AArcSl_2776 [Halalkaliarchaeum desulfuricum]|uniref:DUF5658 domain-containing protein n=1 Tax=Halalkaliarchaeum desulfuricum TaxID=2055893 RepID=A0A343TMR9_9EURY|nr:hypothetical protein [Halalkaliarchaeum desulfuricum]AUX10391.1 hypothetical protein AArcSl_2776 [Halalkaliarchaeum desulfuricum]